MSRGTDVAIRPAGAADWGEAAALLEQAGLPTGDLGPQSLDGFLIAETTAGQCTVGLVGLERLDGVGLLRSLVVAGEQRGSGTGRRLVAAVEAAAVGAGMSELWLLTIDADGYFEGLGFAAVGRDDAPAAVRESREFSELCPGDAVLMMKALRS